MNVIIIQEEFIYFKSNQMKTLGILIIILDLFKPNKSRYVYFTLSDKL